ncbi:MAG: hypothetical protein ACFCVD_13535 [Nodosilinea sp.]
MANILTGIYNAVDPFRPLEPGDPASEQFVSEYQALLNGLRRTQGFGLFFVECEPDTSQYLVQRIQADLGDQTIVELDMGLLAQNGGLFKTIKPIWLTGRQIDIVLMPELEQALTRKADQAAIPPLLVQLNQQREAFRDGFAARFVLLGCPTAITQLMRQAPDFFDWRSGFFRFQNPQIWCC